MKYHAKLHIWTSGLAALANLLSCSTVHVCRRLPYLGLKKWVLLEHSAVTATVTKAGLKLSEQSSPRSGHLTQGDIGSNGGANLIKSGCVQRSAICSARLSLLKYWQYWSCIREPSLKILKAESYSSHDFNWYWAVLLHLDENIWKHSSPSSPNYFLSIHLHLASGYYMAQVSWSSPRGLKTASVKAKEACI